MNEYETALDSLSQHFENRHLSFARIIRRSELSGLGVLPFSIEECTGSNELGGDALCIVCPIATDVLHTIRQAGNRWAKKAACSLRGVVKSSGYQYARINLEWLTQQHLIVIPVATQQDADIVNQFAERGVCVVFVDMPASGLMVESFQAQPLEPSDFAISFVGRSASSPPPPPMSEALNETRYPVFIAAETVVEVSKMFPIADSSLRPLFRKRVSVSVVCCHTHGAFTLGKR